PDARPLPDGQADVQRGLGLLLARELERRRVHAERSTDPATAAEPRPLHRRFAGDHRGLHADAPPHTPGGLRPLLQRQVHPGNEAQPRHRLLHGLSHLQILKRSRGDGMAAETVSVWHPLGNRVFRAMFLAATVSNFGTWMQNVAATWEMTRLSASPLLVA